MDVIEALKSRHSTRAYKTKCVDRETIMKIIEAANYAPSWANTQPWEVFVAGGEVLDNIRKGCLEKFRNNVPPNPDRQSPESWPEAHKERSREMGAAQAKLLGINREDKEARAKLNERNLNYFGAPVTLFLCMDKRLTQWSAYDVGAFSQSVMLAAQSYGLNTIPAVMLSVYPEVIRKELEITDGLDILIGIALGYGDPDNIQNKHITTRKPLEEFVTIKGL